jgi:hypothetical protein
MRVCAYLHIFSFYLSPDQYKCTIVTNCFNRLTLAGRVGNDALKRDKHQSPQPAHNTMLTNLPIVATYRGIDAGWVAVGGPKSKAETERLLTLVNRIRPDFVNKVKEVPVMI